jgi:hypothetical protein
MEISDIVKLVRNEFDPVASKLGLGGPLVDDSGRELSLAYFGEGIGLEIAVDMYEFFVFALVFRANGHSVPRGYEDDKGKRQKFYVQEVLSKLGLSNEGIDGRLQRMRGKWSNCTAMASALAELVEKNWSQIAKHGALLFPNQK